MCQRSDGLDPGISLGTIEELLSAPPELATEIERPVRDVPLAVTLAWRDGA